MKANRIIPRCKIKSSKAVKIVHLEELEVLGNPTDCTIHFLSITKNASAGKSSSSPRSFRKGVLKNFK